MRPRTALAGLLVVSLALTACSGDDDAGPGTTPSERTEPTAETTAPAPQPTDPPTAAAPTTEPSAPETTAPTTNPPVTEDRAYYVLPPGNFGGLPTNDDSLDQLALYDGLTPLRGDIDDADLDQFFLPQNFAPVGATREEDTGRAGTTIVYDDYGVAHITGETRADLAFGAGWVTARDRALLLTLGRGPARAAVADIPGIDAFGLVTSGQSFVPSAAAEQLVTDQVQLLIDTYGAEGEEIVADAQAYADGINAHWAATGVDSAPATVNDVIAVTAFIGSIFGAGGGGEARNAEFLAQLQNRLGDELGRQVWEDLLPGTDADAPTTITETFDYPVLTGGEVTGSVVLDEGSIVAFDPLDAAPQGWRRPAAPTAPSSVDAADTPPHKQASNWLIAAPEASVNGTTLAVMGPQLGYYYPEIVQQIHLSGPGIEAQGAAVPGLAMYMLIGRTADYAWSLTSADQDVRDTFAEVLCEPDGSAPTVASQHYEFDGECVAFEQFDAGALNGQQIVFPRSVHGPVIGTATVDGAPVALTRQRSTFGRDALNLKALKDMTEGDAATPAEFFDVADQFGFTFNWGYANREGIAYFASGYLPVRAPGLDRRLPTLGTGEYEWQGFLTRDQHPHADAGADGRLLNWNNQSAPGFMHGDDNHYGSVHRVELFDGWAAQSELTDVVGVMNNAATQDTGSAVWPVVSELLAGGDAPSTLAAEAVTLLDAWVADDAPIVDGDEDGDYDAAGARVFAEVLGPTVNAVLAPVLGPVLADGVGLRGVGELSIVDEDLRLLLGEQLLQPLQVRYCGAGDIDRCRADVWAAIDAALAQAATELGDDLTAWRAEGRRTTFEPGLIPETFRTTNRPTYQQVIEWAPA
ncbi:MAG TPA: penicillin acylase family protein [Ilumatobacter sp.]|nr:penicillin acylase family protein [Ilumatobacter sp.]